MNWLERVFAWDADRQRQKKFPVFSAIITLMILALWIFWANFFFQEGYRRGQVHSGLPQLIEETTEGR